jgi:hypothetical protein
MNGCVCGMTTAAGQGASVRVGSVDGMHGYKLQNAMFRCIGRCV